MANATNSNSAPKRHRERTSEIPADAPRLSGYLISEDDEMHLNELSQAMRTIGDMCEEIDGMTTCIEVQSLGNVFRAMSTAVENTRTNRRFGFVPEDMLRVIKD